MAKYRPLLKKDFEWLMSLKEALKNDVPEIHTHKRGLTRKEWSRIKKLIKDRSLPCTLHACIYGFGMAIHDHPKFWQKKPPKIFLIDNGHFQKNGQHLFAQEEPCMKNKIKPIAYRSENKQLLGYYGFEPLKESGHYTY